MATDASRGLMRAFQREFRRRVIEGTQYFPLIRVVTGLAGLRGSVRIVMTRGAVLIREVILPGFRRGRDS